jgi:N-acetylglutamate synthase-like GNAT family acetyltransferase
MRSSPNNAVEATGYRRLTADVRHKMKWTQDNFVITDAREAVDVDTVHALLRDAYWAKGRSRETVQATVDQCLCFTLLEGDHQIGFARVLTDGVTYAAILDVVIAPAVRGRGLGKWLMECITNHFALAGLKQILWTKDAEGFYQQYGFRFPDGVKFMMKPPRN